MINNFSLNQVSGSQIVGADIRTTMKDIREEFLSVLKQLMGNGDLKIPGGLTIAEEHKFDAVGSIAMSEFIEQNHQRLDFALQYMTFIKDMDKSASQMASS